MLWYNQSFAQMCLLIRTVFQVSNVAHVSFWLNQGYLFLKKMTYPYMFTWFVVVHHKSYVDTVKIALHSLGETISTRYTHCQ